jgi:hypothetical protein
MKPPENMNKKTNSKQSDFTFDKPEPFKLVEVRAIDGDRVSTEAAQLVADRADAETRQGSFERQVPELDTRTTRTTGY